MNSKVLFINACVRDGSRTRRLAQTALELLGNDYTEVSLADGSVRPLSRESLEKRSVLAQNLDFSDKIFDLAKQFASAETIVIAAPFWDLSFPAVLKAYVENICVVGLTFTYVNDEPKGLCNAKRLIYITTVGGYNPVDFGFSYIKGIAQTFFEIPEVLEFRADGLDIVGNDAEALLNAATQKIINELPKAHFPFARIGTSFFASLAPK